MEKTKILSKDQEEKLKNVTNPQLHELHKSLYVFSNQIPWKDVIPSLISWIEKNQPNGSPYDLKFWIDAYKHKFK